MSKRKYKMEIFAEAKVQCLHCSRFFIKELPHKCNTGYRKRHHKWLQLSLNESSSDNDNI
jgi:hypothetical protein